MVQPRFIIDRCYKVLHGDVPVTASMVRLCHGYMPVEPGVTSVLQDTN